MSDPKRIAIFRVGHIGDMVIAMPALWTVRKRFPNAEIVFLNQLHSEGVYTQGIDVIRESGVIDSVLTYRFGVEAGKVSKLDMVKTLVKLRLKRIGMVVYIPPQRTPAQIKRDALFFRLAGISRIVGMTSVAETVYKPEGNPLPLCPPEVEVTLNHLHRDGIRIDESPYDLVHLGLTDAERAFARSWIAEKGIDLSRPLVGLGPGGKIECNWWPLDRYAAVAEAIIQGTGATVVLIGGPGDREKFQEIVARVPGVVDASGAFTIRQSAALLEHAALFIGNDTGTVHVAASAGTRCIAIQGGRDWPGRWRPYGRNNRTFRFWTPCEGCCISVCDRGIPCILGTEAPEVIGAALQMLREIEGDESTARTLP